MNALTRQQLCVALSISESTVRRLELSGLPYTPVGKRSKRYDLDECKNWLRLNLQTTQPTTPYGTGSNKGLNSAAKRFIEESKHIKRRVMPSE